MSDKLDAATGMQETGQVSRDPFQPHIVRYPGNNLYYLAWKHKGKRYELSLETDVDSRAPIKGDEITKTEPQGQSRNSH